MRVECQSEAHGGHSDLAVGRHLTHLLTLFILESLAYDGGRDILAWRIVKAAFVK